MQRALLPVTHQATLFVELNRAPRATIIATNRALVSATTPEAEIAAMLALAEAAARLLVRLYGVPSVQFVVLKLVDGTQRAKVRFFGSRDDLLRLVARSLSVSPLAVLCTSRVKLVDRD